MISAPKQIRDRARRSGARRADEGSSLILCLVFIIVVSPTVIPVMDHIMTVTRSNRVLVNRCTSMTQSPQVPCGKPYPYNGNTDTVAWVTDTTSSTYLPGKKTSLGVSWSGRSFGAAGRIEFENGGSRGEWIRLPLEVEVVITSSKPVYFVSGIYYFEKSLRISGDALVVVGAGIAAGCADSAAVAVADAPDAPPDAYSSGVGGTFVFGANGRFVVDTATAGGSTGASIVLHRRLVATKIHSPR